jgi:hypothetical protein
MFRVRLIRYQLINSSVRALYLPLGLMRLDSKGSGMIGSKPTPDTDSHGRLSDFILDCYLDFGVF